MRLLCKSVEIGKWMATKENFTFISQCESSQLRIVFEGFHTNDVFGDEPNNCNLVLFDEARPCLGLFPSFLVHQADQSL